MTQQKHEWDKTDPGEQICLKCGLRREQVRIHWVEGQRAYPGWIITYPDGRKMAAALRAGDSACLVAAHHIQGEQP